MKQFSIIRTRYVIVRDEKEILCGILGRYKFCPFDEVKKAALKTYDSQARAMAGLRKFIESCHEQKKHTYQIVPVVESIIAAGPEFKKMRGK